MMTAKYRSLPLRRPHRRGGLAARQARLARLAFAAALLLSGLAATSVSAQEPENTRAGIVIDFGDGVVESACVDLGADGQATGEEVLAAAGFDVLIEYSPMGGAVCRIGSLGCNFPDQSCWCECMSSPCVYWAYNHLQGGQWVYSSIGASIYTVRAGDVEGWAWGAGSLTQGATPPVRTFDQICAASMATSTPTSTPTATPTWTPWPTNTPPPTATWTPWPTNAPPPTATWTPWPTDTPPPTATWTAQPGDTATSPAVAALDSPSPTPEPTDTPAAIALAAPPVEPASRVRDAQASLFIPLVGRHLAAPAGENAVVPELAPPADAPPADAPEMAVEPAAAPPPIAAAAPLLMADEPATTPPDASPARFPRADAASAGTGLTTQAAPDYTLLALLTLACAAALSVGRAAPRRVRAGRQRQQRQPPRRQPRSAPGRPARQHALSALVYGLSTAIGVLALLYPFLAAALRPVTGQPASLNGPGLMLVLLGVCFAGLLLEVQGQAVSAKLIALLGVLVAINSVLRFVEVGIPGPGGFSPVFVLIILTGYVFGGRFGFLMGALTMLVSAVFTGGVGPWLPAQMFAAGWIGLSAPLARPLARLAGARPGSRRELALLAVFAAVWGLLFGAIMNLWFWPFLAGPAEQYWQAGISLAETARRYLAYYLATSLVWDALRLVGNAGLMLVFGAATLRALRRFGQRFTYQYQPEPAAQSPAAEGAAPRHRSAPVPGPVQSASSRG